MIMNLDELSEGSVSLLEAHDVAEKHIAVSPRLPARAIPTASPRRLTPVQRP
jgi:hypothetical protein